jgi:hypothetical protein
LIPLFLSGSTDLSGAQSLTEMFVDVCFAALAANGKPFFDGPAGLVIVTALEK